MKEKGKVTNETVFAISSLSPNQAPAERLLSFNRGHWNVESTHWVRDASMGEDACREKRDNIGENLAALRNVCLNLLRISGVKGIASTLRRFAWNSKDLLKFLSRLNN